MSGRKVWFITGAGRGMGVDFATAVLAAGVGWLRAARVLTTLLAVAWSILWAGAASAADATEQAVLAADERRRDATLRRRRGGRLDDDRRSHLHARERGSGDEGRVPRRPETGRYQYKSLTDEERGVRVHGDTGIVSGTCRIVVAAAGKDIDIRVRFTELWVKIGSAWRMVLWHATNGP